MENNDKLKRTEKFFREIILGWMINDLNKSISAKTNFLTALGCLVYTEAIGTFLPIIQKEKGSEGQRRFYRCLFRLKSSKDLETLDKLLLRETNKGIYQQVRHNMAHIYFPAVKRVKNGVVQFIPTTVARDGLTIITAKSGQIKTRSSPILLYEGRIFLATRNYVSELKDAYHRFYKTIFIDKDKEWVKSAENGIDIIQRGKIK